MRIFDENYYGASQYQTGDQNAVLPPALTTNQALNEQSTILEGEEGNEENVGLDHMDDHDSGQGPAYDSNFEPETAAVIAHHLHGEHPDVLGQVLTQYEQEAVTPQEVGKGLDQDQDVPRRRAT